MKTTKHQIVFGLLIKEPPGQQMYISNNLDLTCISEAGGCWWRGFVSTGQIMSSQPDVDRWRQRLALPPAHCYTHTFGNQFFTGQLPCDLCQPSLSLTHTHTCTLFTNYRHTHTRNDNSHSLATYTHEILSHTCACSTSPPGLQNMAASSAYEGHSSFLTHTHLADCVFFLFQPRAWSHVQFTPSLCSVNSIISDYFLISIAALIHLLVTYLCCCSQLLGW